MTDQIGEARRAGVHGSVAKPRFAVGPSPASRTWTTLPDSVDGAGKASATTTHFTAFGVVSEASGGASGGGGSAGGSGGSGASGGAGAGGAAGASGVAGARGAPARLPLAPADAETSPAAGASVTRLVSSDRARAPAAPRPPALASGGLSRGSRARNVFR